MQIKDVTLEPGLYIVATPIGNMADITIRALQTLKAADYVACEDSRVTNKLLSHYDIKASMLIYNDHSDERERERILELIESGSSIALVSDAGTPLISDPGYKLVQSIRARQLPVTTCPGASSVMSALILSGLPSNNFVFFGFLSAKQEARRKQLKEIKAINKTTIIFESSNRLTAALADIKEVLGSRMVSVVREITKLFEEVKSSELDEVMAYYQSNPARGEVVIVIGHDENFDGIENEETLDRQLITLLQEHSVRDSVEIISQNSDLSKKEIYKRALALRNALIPN